MSNDFARVPDVLFIAAGVLVLAHVVLSRAVLRNLTSDALKIELFAVPNRLLGTPDRLRLMRVRYFWPFRALPDAARSLDPGLLLLIRNARFAGFGFLCAILGFFASIFIEVGY